uniref:Uncharacterized protein n=1 Tax=Bursaphelenchus xylophilus TaxID=6326 RepID=A0A1I7SN64_BURXY
MLLGKADSCSIAENAMHEEEFSSYKFLCI